MIFLIEIIVQNGWKYYHILKENILLSAVCDYETH